MDNKKFKKFYLISLVILCSISLLIFDKAFGITPKCDINKLKVVSYEQKNVYVRNLQYCLLELGYYISDKEFGIYGNSTVNAVKKFYKDNAEEIYKLAYKTNSLWQIKNWSGRKIGKAGIQVLKNKIKNLTIEKDEKTSVKTSIKTNNQKLLILILQLLKSMGEKTQPKISSQAVNSTSSQQVILSGVIGGTVSGGTSRAGAISSGGFRVSYPKIGVLIKNNKDIKINTIKRLNENELFIIGSFDNNGIIIGKYNLADNSQNITLYNTQNFQFTINNILQLGDSWFILGEKNNATSSPILIKISNNQINWAFEYFWPDASISCNNLDYINSNLHLYCTLENLSQGESSVLILIINLNGELVSNYYYSDLSYDFMLKNATKDFSSNSILLVDLLNPITLQKNICIWKVNNLYNIEKTRGFTFNNEIIGSKVLFYNNLVYITGNILESGYLNIFLTNLDSNFNIVLSKIYKSNNFKIPLYGLIDQQYLQLIGNFQDSLLSNRNLFYLSLNPSNGSIISSKIYKNLNYDTYPLAFSNDVDNNLLINGTLKTSEGNYWGFAFNIGNLGEVNFKSSSNFMLDNLSLTAYDLTSIQNVACQPNRVGSLLSSYFQINPVQFSSTSTNFVIEKIIE